MGTFEVFNTWYHIPDQKGCSYQHSLQTQKFLSYLYCDCYLPSYIFPLLLVVALSLFAAFQCKQSKQSASLQSQAVLLALDQFIQSTSHQNSFLCVCADHVYLTFQYSIPSQTRA